MTTPIISSENLTNLIDQCVADLRSGDGSKLYDLAGVFNSIAECNSEAYLSIIPQGIGSFYSELMAGKSLTIVPVLPEEMRNSHKKVVDVAVEQAIKALEEIKIQFCNSSTDYEKLMKSIGIFFQQAGTLSSKRRQFSRPSPHSEGE